MIVVLRNTYGWHKKEDRISLSQFCRDTGVSRPNVNRSLKVLVARGILLVVAKSLPAYTYKFNKNYDQWGSSTVATSSKADNLGGSSNSQKGGSSLATHKNNNKNNITKERENNFEINENEQPHKEPDQTKISSILDDWKEHKPWLKNATGIENQTQKK